MNLTQHNVRRSIFTLIATLAVVLSIPAGLSLAQADPLSTNVDDLNQAITEKRKQIEVLNRQAQAFEQNLRIKEQEVRSLTGELSTIDQQTEKTELDLQITQTSIEALELEITSVETKLAQKRSEVSSQQDRLAELVRHIYRQRQRPMLEVAVTEKSFADFFNTVQGLTQLQEDARASLERLAALQNDLQIAQEDLTGKQDNLGNSKRQLEVQQTALAEAKDFKSTLLRQSELSQNQFEALLNDIRSDADSINAEINTLESKVREQLGDDGGDATGNLGKGPLSWPVDPIRGISAYFHDPSYPFRCAGVNRRSCIGEHSGIDVPTPQGTAVRAASDGYVAIARNPDWVRDANGRIIRPAYNYVMLLHADNVSSVYGHLSRVLVTEDTYVEKGDIIGLSGALPGTAGAGAWTTGAHLHFEVRVNGIPQDPLNFLQ